MTTINKLESRKSLMHMFIFCVGRLLSSFFWVEELTDNHLFDNILYLYHHHLPSLSLSFSFFFFLWLISDLSNILSM